MAINYGKGKNTSIYNLLKCEGKALVGAFNQEKAIVGAFSVIVQLHRLIDLRLYSAFSGHVKNFLGDRQTEVTQDSAAAFWLSLPTLTFSIVACSADFRFTDPELACFLCIETSLQKISLLLKELTEFEKICAPQNINFVLIHGDVELVSAVCGHGVEVEGGVDHGDHAVEGDGPRVPRLVGQHQTHVLHRPGAGLTAILQNIVGILNMFFFY